jgi:hypothetical protein
MGPPPDREALSPLDPEPETPSGEILVADNEKPRDLQARRVTYPRGTASCRPATMR